MIEALVLAAAKAAGRGCQERSKTLSATEKPIVEDIDQQRIEGRGQPIDVLAHHLIYLCRLLNDQLFKFHLLTYTGSVIVFFQHTKKVLNLNHLPDYWRGRQTAEEQAAVPFGKQPGIEHRNQASVAGRTHQAADPLAKAQHRPGYLKIKEWIAAVIFNRLHPSLNDRVC